MRKFIVTVCALVLIIVIGMHLLLFTPFRLPPEIGRELPSSFSEADKEFARRIATEFRLPLNERELVRNLKQKGFSVLDEKDYASFEKQQFPCMLFWRVFWTDQGGVVTELKSMYGGSCL